MERVESTDSCSSYQSCLYFCACQCCPHNLPCNSSYRDIHILTKLKDYQRIRIIKNKVEIENRWTMWRFFTDDSRWKTLTFLEKLHNEYEMNNIVIIMAAQTLYNTTYKNDKKWKEEAEKIFQV